MRCSQLVSFVLQSRFSWPRHPKCLLQNAKPFKLEIVKQPSLRLSDGWYPGGSNIESCFLRMLSIPRSVRKTTRLNISECLVQQAEAVTTTSTGSCMNLWAKMTARQTAGWSRNSPSSTTRVDEFKRFLPIKSWRIEWFCCLFGGLKVSACSPSCKLTG